MKRCLAILLLLATLPVAAAFAQSTPAPATKEDVQQLFELMQFHKQFDSIADLLRKQMPAIAQSTLSRQLPQATPEQVAAMNQFMDEEMATIFRSMPLDDLMQAMLPAYQHHFTHDELQELIRFYQSPVGRKMVSESPEIMSEYMQNAAPIMQKWTAGMVSDMKARAEAHAKKLKESPPAVPEKKS